MSESATGSLPESTGIQPEITDEESRALATLCEDWREHEPPELDWGQIEAELMNRVAREPVALHRPKKTQGVWGQLGLFAAAAAAIALLFSGMPGAGGKGSTRPSANAMLGSQVDPRELALVDTDRVSAADPKRARNVAAVARGSWIETADEAVELALPGIAHWRLEPGSKIVLKGGRKPYRFRLERGEVHVRVVPRHDSSELSEALVIDAGGTQVAVHGTIFHVRKQEKSVEVEVQRGVVTVGPAGYRGPTTGRLLAAPMRGEFTLDGGRRARLLPPRGTTRTQNQPVNASAATGNSSLSVDAKARHLRAPAVSPNGGEDTAATASRSTPRIEQGAADATARKRTVKPATKKEPSPTPQLEEPAAGMAPLSKAALQSMVLQCVRRSFLNAGNKSGHLVSVNSTVTVQLGEDGFARSVRFVPPLPVATQQRCSSLVFGRKLSGEGELRFGVHVTAR